MIHTVITQRSNPRYECVNTVWSIKSGGTHCTAASVAGHNSVLPCPAQHQLTAQRGAAPAWLNAGAPRGGVEGHWVNGIHVPTGQSLSWIVMSDAIFMLPVVLGVSRQLSCTNMTICPLSDPDDWTDLPPCMYWLAFFFIVRGWVTHSTSVRQDNTSTCSSLVYLGQVIRIINNTLVATCMCCNYWLVYLVKAC